MRGSADRGGAPSVRPLLTLSYLQTPAPLGWRQFIAPGLGCDGDRGNRTRADRNERTRRRLGWPPPPRPLPRRRLGDAAAHRAAGHALQAHGKRANRHAIHDQAPRPSLAAAALISAIDHLSNHPDAATATL